MSTSFKEPLDVLSLALRKLREILNFSWLFHLKKNPISLKYLYPRKKSLTLKIIKRQMKFCIGATFQMRTVLYQICLFNDKVIMHDRVFISKQIMQGESKTVERQK